MRRRQVANRWGVTVGGLVYLLVLFDFGADPFRTATRQRFFSNFFDVQAQSFLRGRLDVPSGSLGIEGFVLHGRTYEYFPPFPALLRIPVMLITHEFDGRLTLISMALAWALFAAIATRLYWLVRNCLRGTAPIGRTETFAAGCALAAATGGTTLTYDAALPWVYNEVYVWECALVLASLYWLLRLSLEPGRAAVGWTAACNVGAIMTRTTGGAAVCAATFGVGVWLLTGRPHPDHRRVGWWVLAAAVVPVALSVAYNLIKFDHPYLFPLQDQVWTMVNTHRREALARNGGTITGPQFLATTTMDYLRPDGIRFTSFFPFITLPARAAPAYGGAYLDQTYRTGSATAFMPLLFLTAMWGCAQVARRRRSFGVRALRLPVIGTVLLPVGILDYGYVAQRYVSEFVPFVVLGGFIGTVDVARRLAGRRMRVKAAPLALLSVAALLGVIANAAAGYAVAQQTWGGHKIEQYVAVQRALSRVTGNPLAARTREVQALPSRAPTDDLYIIGDCAGLYLSSGDRYQPWLAVQQRISRVRVVVSATRPAPALIPLFSVPSAQRTVLSVQTSGSGRMRVVVDTAGAITRGSWQLMTTGTELDVTLAPRTDLGLMEVTSLPGGHVAWIPFVEWDSHWRNVIAQAVRTPDDASAERAAGVRIVTGTTPRPALCSALARDAGLRPQG